MRNPKLLILVGAPGAGKSTFTKYLLRTEDNWFRVNRDDFRMMQFSGSNMEVDQEKLLSKVINAAIHQLLSQKCNVVIDATHTQKRYLDAFVNEFGGKADISFKVFDIPLEELQARVDERYERTGKHIPKSVLKKQYGSLQKLIEKYDFSERKMTKVKVKYTEQSEQLPKSIICDLDGTLALMNGRNPFDGSRCDEDLPNPPVVNLVKQYHKLGYRILLLSGRSDAYKPQTIKWLDMHDISYDMLVMRQEGDYRKDSVVKEEFYRENIENKFFVEVVLDDRNQVVDLWRQTLGLACFQVNYGDF